MPPECTRYYWCWMRFQHKVSYKPSNFGMLLAWLRRICSRVVGRAFSFSLYLKLPSRACFQLNPYVTINLYLIAALQRIAHVNWMRLHDANYHHHWPTIHSWSKELIVITHNLVALRVVVGNTTAQAKCCGQLHHDLMHGASLGL
mgnify:FL=1